MGRRSRTAEVLSSVISFAEVVRSTVQATLFILEHDADDESDESEYYGDAALLSRPASGADTLFVDLDGERVVFGMRETRWMVAMDEGDAVLRALGADTRAYIRLKKNGDIELVGGDNAVTALAARADRTDAALTKLQVAFDQHTHLTAGTGSPVPPTAVPGAIPVGALPSSAADKVRIT